MYDTNQPARLRLVNLRIGFSLAWNAPSKFATLPHAEETLLFTIDLRLEFILPLFLIGGLLLYAALHGRRHGAVGPRPRDFLLHADLSLVVRLNSRGLVAVHNPGKRRPTKYRYALLFHVPALLRAMTQMHFNREKTVRTCVVENGAV